MRLFQRRHSDVGKILTRKGFVMYLGKRVSTVKAVDTKTVYAQSHDREAHGTQVVPTILVSSEEENRVVRLEKELTKAKEMNAHLRGRLLFGLRVLRGKNRAIARLERELAAHSAENPLTLESIMQESTSAGAVARGLFATDPQIDQTWR